MGLEELPDRLAGVEIMTNRTDEYLGKILNAIGPGVTAADDLDEDNFCSVGAVGKSESFFNATIVWVSIGEIFDHGLRVAMIELAPFLNRVIGGDDACVFLETKNSYVATIVGDEGVGSGLNNQDGDGLCRVE